MASVWSDFMGTTVSVTEAVRHFTDYVNRVAYRGESFFLRKGKRVVAEIRPVPHGRKLEELADILAALPHLPPDDADAFAKDVEEARNVLSRKEVANPWES
jgi:antitoxin (DNA-binding transcriptional repressor) of toxin-antitoxin stability system